MRYSVRKIVKLCSPWALAVIAISVVSVGGVAFAVSTTDRGTEVRQFASGQSTSPALGANEFADRGFAVFGRQAKASDVPSDEVVGAQAFASGADLKASRRLENDAGEIVYATPIRGGVCLSSSTYVVSSCRPTFTLAGSGADALNGLEATSCSPFLPVDKAVIAGLVSDGVDAVSLKYANKSTTEVKIKDNFLLAILDRSGPVLESLSWADQNTGKTYTVRSPLPSDAYSDKCVPTDVDAQIEKAKQLSLKAAQDIK